MKTKISNYSMKPKLTKFSALVIGSIVIGMVYLYSHFKLSIEQEIINQISAPAINNNIINSKNICSFNNYNIRIIFIDGGANIGDSFEKLMKLHQPFLSPFMKKVFQHCIEAYLFEVNPLLFDQLNNIKQKYDSKLKLIKIEQKAMWDRIDTVPIHLDTFNKDYNFDGSTLFQSKSSRLSNSTINVPSISFCDYLLNTIGLSKYNNGNNIDNVDNNDLSIVVVKLDIEGAEFDVLNQLIKNKQCMDIINDIFIEFHERHLSDEQRKTLLTRNQYKSILAKNNINVHHWD